MRRFFIPCLFICMILLSACTTVNLQDKGMSLPSQQPSDRTPDTADTPDVPDVPDTPDVPDDPDTPDITDTPNPFDTDDTPDIPDEPEIKETVIKIAAAGDNLLHNTISFDARQEDGSYDFSSIYTRIAHIAQGAQIAFVNQEIMLTGKISGYPRMEAPAEAADALLNAGFNVINLASNHTLDKGEDGLAACISNVKQRGFDAILGVYETREESETPILVEKDGIVFGFLSYTYDMNGYTLSEGNEWKVDLINEPVIKADLSEIRPLCDYLIVSMHWGVEYQTSPSSYQRKLAQLLCDNGADLIIGTHPHVLQPLETLSSSDGTRETLCAWSLGNFISNQHIPETMLGGILQAELVFDESKKLVSVRSGIIPTVTHYDDSAKNYEIYLLNDYTQELASVHGIRKHADTPLTLPFLQELAQNILGEAISNEVY